MQDIVSFIQYHLMLSLMFITVLILLLILEILKIKRAVNQLSPLQAVQFMNHQKAVVVDVRPAEAFASGHIVGAISLPLAKLSEKMKKLEKFKAQPLILIYSTHAECSRAATLLLQQGFTVRILAGGLQAWKEAQMPLVKG